MRKLRITLNAFIEDLKETKNVTKSCINLNISDEEFGSWISKDKWDVEPYSSFQNSHFYSLIFDNSSQFYR